MGSFPPSSHPKDRQGVDNNGKDGNSETALTKAQTGGKVAGIFGDIEEHSGLRGSGELVIKLERQIGGSRISTVKQRNLDLT